MIWTFARERETAQNCCYRDASQTSTINVYVRQVAALRIMILQNLRLLRTCVRARQSGRCRAANTDTAETRCRINFVTCERLLKTVKHRYLKTILFYLLCQHTCIFDHPQRGVIYNFGRVCLSDDNFQKPWRRRFIFAHVAYISMHYGSSWYMKVIRSRSRSLEPKRQKISIFPQCKNSTGNNSHFIKHRAVIYACSTGFSGTEDRMV